ncbi:NAD(P)/FAD-dependent oxidoreductase [Candidatus Uhrbacteria bacterium]|nr:NAD(P)/FAD-dependent oxidoreductase [Candidatus Uhrbacteria bacterium]
MEQGYDVIIVGASFAGLALAHHLPRELRVLVVDAKPEAGSTVESTGLITEKTRAEWASFFDIDAYITNPITSICVVAPGFDDYFVSSTGKPWIYQTDTKALIKALADSVPAHVTVRMATVFLGVDDTDRVSKVKIQSRGGAVEELRTRFLVGADGSHSRVASLIGALDQNRCFLFGYEQVFFGDVRLGPHPAETIYHFWFGEFSLGYGGWLSPTVVGGRKAFRIGLAKLMEDRGHAKELMEKFMRILVDRGVITVEGDIDAPGYVFGSMIPIGGALERIAHENVMLIGDAAGFCGAFAADGIKGSVVSGKEAAPLINRFLRGDASAPAELKARMEVRSGLMEYYRRQIRYRWIWDLMQSDRTFRAMYDIIESERTTFLDQFCDSKDHRRSLARTVVKVRHIPKLIRYSWSIVCDQLALYRTRRAFKASKGGVVERV